MPEWDEEYDDEEHDYGYEPETTDIGPILRRTEGLGLQRQDDVLRKGRPLTAISLPVIRNRAARPMSFEQEFSSGRRWLSGAFYAGGITSFPDVLSYHSEPGMSCYLEDDASVDVEVIWSKLDLSNSNHPEFLARGQEIIKSGIRADAVSLSYDCGFHVHVGLQKPGSDTNYSSRNLESLYHLWNHVEDTMFRLGSANWSKHRTEIESNYAIPTRKGLTRRGLSRSSEREWALNLRNYLYSKDECTCGAVEWGVWEECSCQLTKPTVEFRVFNGTANPRKIRAYAALSLALVEKARKIEVKAEEFVPLQFEGTHTHYLEQSRNRLDFVLNELPLSRQERGDVLYCASRSSLNQILSDKERQLI